MLIFSGTVVTFLFRGAPLPNRFLGSHLYIGDRDVVSRALALNAVEMGIQTTKVRGLSVEAMRLELPNGGGSFRGDVEVSRALLWASNGHAAVYAGTRASLAILGMVSIGALYGGVFAMWLRFLPVLGIVGCSILNYPCLTCSNGTGFGWEAGVPIAAFGLTALATWVLLWPSATLPRAFNALVAVCLASLTAQAGLLVANPKFCIGCLCVTAMAVFTVAGIFHARCQNAKCVTLTRPVAAAISSLVLLPIAHGVLLLGGVTKSALGAPTASIVGMDIRQFVPDLPDNDLRRTLIVIEPGCGACNAALARLPGFGVHFTPIRVQAFFVSAHSFHLNGHSVKTPTFLKTNANGKVVFEYAGWPVSQLDQQALVNDLKNLEEETNGK